jgi:hypothetical protein
VTNEHNTHRGPQYPALYAYSLTTYGNESSKPRHQNHIVRDSAINTLPRIDANDWVNEYAQ